jgi:hypothetical protein
MREPGTGQLGDREPVARSGVRHAVAGRCSPRSVVVRNALNLVHGRSAQNTGHAYKGTHALGTVCTGHPLRVPGTRGRLVSKSRSPGGWGNVGLAITRVMLTRPIKQQVPLWLAENPLIRYTRPMFQQAN